jgi:hypothetical protein
MRHLGNLAPRFSSEGPYNHSWSIPEEFVPVVYFLDICTH